MQEQQEVTVRLGLDASQFEQRLRETDRIARQYANKQGAALNAGSENGGTPASWQSIGSLSVASQALVRNTSEANSVVNQIVGRLGDMYVKFNLLKIAAQPIVEMSRALRDSIRLAETGEDLQTSSKFALTLERAALRAGESPDSAIGKLQRVQALIGAAQEGNKEALGLLNKLGVSPWGKTMEETYLAIAEALNKIEDPAKRARAAAEAFGKQGGMQMLDILSKLGDESKRAKLSLVEQKDLDLLERAAREGKSLWDSFKTYGRDWAIITTAGLLRTFGMADKEKPGAPTLEAPGETKEERDARIKAAKDLAEAKREYETALRNEGSLQEQLNRHRSHAWKLEDEIRTTAGETVEKYKKQKELLDERRKLSDLQKQLDAQAERAAEMRLNIENRINDAKAARANLDDSRSDRSGWSVDDIANQPFRRNARGWAIIPQQLFAAAQNFLGRPLGQGEVNQMSRNFEMAYRQALGAKHAGMGAHALRMLLPQFSDEATSTELGIRRQMEMLTTGERDPLRSQAKSIQDMDKNIAEILRKAERDGLVVRPRLSRRQ